jgi:catechol 2,3-dioxygenase-like lactoylglutathione lyase family enzyme
MIDHVSLGATDLLKARAFYDAALAPLGFRRVYDMDDASGYGASDGKPFFWIGGPPAPGQKMSPSPGTHIAFAAPDRAAVDKFYAAAIAAGGSDNGKPGPRPEYHADYYGAFVRDLDGHHVEAVCHRPA